VPTARELLEQADALMRRNRAAAGTEPSPVVAPSVEPTTPRPAALDQAASASAMVLDDIPVLTDAVEEIEVPSIVAPVPDEGESSVWLEEAQDTPSIFGDTPDSIAIVPPAVAVEAAAASHERASDHASHAAEPSSWREPAAEPDAAPQSSLEPAAGPVAEPQGWLEPAAEPVADTESHRATAIVGMPAAEVLRQELSPAETDARWHAMAEEVRMQVLQRIDLFTDTGLREQLGARLQPIVDRASADLVAAINQHVGDLLRTYVAEAIEREIEHWRADR
jgi:hypothetical protein